MSKAEKKPQAGMTVQNCTITNTSAANEHTRAAVEALAQAAGENARAIAAIAVALKGSPAHMEHGMHISGAGS